MEPSLGTPLIGGSHNFGPSHVSATPLTPSQQPTILGEVLPDCDVPLSAVSHFIERKKEIITEIPKTEIVMVEHHVEVPGQIVEVPKQVLVDTQVIVPRYIDEVVPSIISQRIEPIIREATEEDGIFVDVHCRVVTFKPAQVDVFVPLPVNRELVAKTKYEQHREVDPALVPAEQYNALVKSLNAETPLEHVLPLFQVTPEVSRRIARRDYQGISAVGAIPCASGPGAAFVEVAEGTPIYPPGAHDAPHKVFPGGYPAAGAWKPAQEAIHAANRAASTRKANNTQEQPEHRYKPYNYKFSSNSHFDMSQAAPFHVHHHIGQEIKR